MSLRSGRRGGSQDSSAPQQPTRRLACRRCNRQKLQCRWEEEDDQACIRCRRANAMCTSSTPRRLGRPTQGRRSSSASAQERASINDHHHQHPPYHHNQSAADLPLPNCNATTTPNTSSSMNGWSLAFPRWPTPGAVTDSSSNAPVMGLSSEGGQSSILNSNTQFGDDDLWHLTIGSFSSPPSTTTPATATTASSSLVNAAFDVSRMGQVDPTIDMASSVGQAVHAEQEQAMSECHGGRHHHQRLPLDAQEDCMQKLWGLQQLLYQQLKQVRAITGAADTITNGAGAARSRYPVDRILDSSKAFIDMLRRFNPLLSSTTTTPSNSGGASEASGLARSNTVAAADNGNPCSLPAETAADQPSSSSLSNPQVNRSDTPVELDTPMMCIVVSCYVRLIDTYDETFQYLSKWLQSILWRQSALQSNLPPFQLGEFHLDDGGSLQVTIIVKIFLHALRCVEKTMGFLGEHSVVGRGATSSKHSEGPNSDQTTNGVFGQLERDKMLNMILTLEADGSGYRKGSIESLRGNIRKVNELLEST